MKRILLALRLLRRDLRAGELNLLALALLIAVSSTTAITLFADRMHRTLNNQAAEFMAGDLVVSSPAPLDAGLLTQADQMGLAQAQTCEFSSVLLEHNEMLLASVKAVSSHYPLRAYLKTVDGDFANETIQLHGPAAGEAWVENRVLSALQLKLGEQLTVGEKTLTITRILSYEPDKRSNFYNYAPRVMINLDDLQAAKVIQPGSRAQFGYQFSGEERVILDYKHKIKPQLLASQRVQDIHEDRPELGSALTRAEQYLGLSSIVVVLIAGVAIAMATQLYSDRHFDAAALLRCLGCGQAEIVRLFGSQILLLGLIVSTIGCLIGWLVQQGLFLLLKELLPPQLAQPSILAYGFGFFTGMAILLAFAMPPLLRLRNVAPLRVLRRDLTPMPSKVWLVYGLGFALVTVLVWRYTGNLKMTGLILGVGLLVMLALSLSIYWLLSLSRQAIHRLSLGWRFGLQNLLRNRIRSTGQILAFGITLTAMGISFAVRHDLLDNWQKQLPEHAPNHFALNIFTEQLTALQTDLQLAQIDTSQFYPVVRGRLVAINDTPVQQRVVKDSMGDEATRRDLSLTWAEQLPEDNKIIAGEPWQTEEQRLVSVEQKLAENLNIALGDQLTFLVGNEQLLAKVASIRNVQWDTLRPNFYMIFSPGSLDAFPRTYLTSFYLPPDQKVRLNGLLKKYPAMTVLEVELILQQFKTIVTQLTQAINLLLYFALLAGFSVLFTAVQATLSQRIYEGALLRTLGARIDFLRRAQLIEFMLLGALSGGLALIAAEAVLFVVDKQLMHIGYSPSFYLWLALPLSGILAVGLAGYWGVRVVLKLPPLPILRRLQ